MRRATALAVLVCYCAALLGVGFLGVVASPSVAHADGTGGGPPPPDDPFPGDTTGGQGSLPPGGDDPAEPSHNAQTEYGLVDALALLINLAL